MPDHQNGSSAPAARSSRADYQRKRREQSVEVYFDGPEDLAAHKLMAQRAGYRTFNKWVLQMLQNATSGSIFPPDYVDSLTKEIEKLREWLDHSRDENVDYRTQLKDVQGQRDTLLTLLHTVPEGSEAARLFLESTTRGAA